MMSGRHRPCRGQQQQSIHSLRLSQMYPGYAAPERSFSAALAALCAQGAGQLLGGLLLEALQVGLSSSVGPEFWAGLTQPENELEERDRAWVLLSTFRTLLERLEPFLGKL